MTVTTLQRRQVFYSGDVQGVGFRFSTRTIAQGLDVAGYVRNLPDRRVELVAEGSEEQLDMFLAAINERMSRQIRKVDCDCRLANGEFATFSIRY